MDALGIYLAEIGRYPRLTAEQEIELGRQIQRGRAAADLAQRAGLSPLDEQYGQLQDEIAAGETARQQFINANYRLVVSIAKRYLRPGLSLLDLIQDGNLGLLRAVETFKPELGYRFAVYAGCAIDRAIRRGDWRLEARLSRVGCLSLDAPLGETSSQLVAEVTSAEMGGDSGSEWFEREYLERLLAQLPPRSQQILKLRFGWDGHSDGLTLEETATQFGLTGERVRQIEAGALKKLQALYGRGVEPRPANRSGFSLRPQEGTRRCRATPTSTSALLPPGYRAA